VSALARGFRGERGLTVGTVAEATASDRLPFYMEPDPETGMGHAGGTWTYGAQGAEVRVSRRTGKVEVLHFVSAFDVGRVISPRMIRGQIVGGVLMGIGQTLMEEVEFGPDGVMTNPAWNRYRIPRLADRPVRQTVHCVETPEAGGPFGARCIAEHPMVAVSPTILNALRDATGHDFWRVPVRPADVLAAIGGAR
jgi:CO/xanthine dehydrogenase Mo-binding subunit